MNQAPSCVAINAASPILPSGRYRSEEERLIPYWPLSGVNLAIQCTQLSIQIEAICTDYAPWIAVFADDSLVARFPVQSGRHWYPVLQGMDAAVPHRISIVNDTQPIDGNDMQLAFCAIQTDGELLPPPQPAYHFEFVGDSLTTGEGCIGPVSANEWKTIWMCPSQGYAHFLCKEMNAQASLISQSGWGVFCDWANQPHNNLPRIYDQLCGVHKDGQIPYHFRQKMDAVIINLGTNDISALKSLPEEQRADRAEQLKQAVASFLRQIRRHNPCAYLLWAYGMCGQEWIHCFTEGVERAKADGDSRIGFCALPSCTKEETGSRMHPGPENHKKAARAIADHLKAVLT